uniref:Glycosyl transferase family 1 domain-containing protein n=1 Tax=viral metagenome TaxID=1070528 RepID=A0A6C0E220_9ZZZZ
MSRVLFVLKRRENYDPIKHIDISLQCGLYNSIYYVHNMLLSQNIESQISICIDNNCINGLIVKFKPTHVIVEALWVVPEKIKLLQSMYPNIKWIIRLHSAIPFFSIESSQSMKWTAEYVKIPNVFIGVNDMRLFQELDIYLSTIVKECKLIYLPNYYPTDNFKNYNKNLIEKECIDISCFGAIRPFKNILTQALASIEFCKRNNKNLIFHINSDRNELNGSTVFLNLINLFSNLDENEYKLVCHPWSKREDFLEICKTIDIGMQVSFTETFNIVSADLVSNGVPVLGSSEIPWLDLSYIANPVDVEHIVNQISYVYNNSEKNVRDNQDSLLKYTNETIKIWNEYLCS